MGAYENCYNKRGAVGRIGIGEVYNKLYKKEKQITQALWLGSVSREARSVFMSSWLEFFILPCRLSPLFKQISIPFLEE